MIDYVLLTGGVVYTANEYYKLKKVVDVYPEKLNEVVKRIKDSLDSKTYEFLTNIYCDDKPNNPVIEGISGNCTKIVKFKDCPDFVVKTSKVGLGFEISRKGKEDFLGNSYVTTNAEGGVTWDLFRFSRRVIVAKKLRKIVKENHLDRIKIPKKYLCSFPDRLVPPFSTPFQNRHVFILCERCEVAFVGEKTVDELKKMSKSDVESLAKQIHIFFLKSGILDFLPHNFYIKDGKMVIFDTEPMSLTAFHFLCVSPTLRGAKINFRNLERNFSNTFESQILVDEAKRSITQIRAKERQKFPRAVCITFIFLSTWVFLNYLERSLFSGKGIISVYI